MQKNAKSGLTIDSVRVKKMTDIYRFVAVLQRKIRLIFTTMGIEYLKYGRCKSGKIKERSKRQTVCLIAYHTCQVTMEAVTPLAK